MNFYKEKS